MKAYTLKQGKLIPAFNGIEYKTLSEILIVIRWWFEARRNDQSTQFLIVDDDRLVQIVNKITF